MGGCGKGMGFSTASQMHTDSTKYPHGVIHICVDEFYAFLLFFFFSFLFFSYKKRNKRILRFVGDWLRNGFCSA